MAILHWISTFMRVWAGRYRPERHYMRGAGPASKHRSMAILHWISTFAGKIMRVWADRYRPERHYMRGAGPASKRSQRQGAGS